MGHAAGAGHRLQMEPVEQFVRGAPESLSTADLDRRDSDMHGVDEVRLEELPNSGDPAPNPYVLALSRIFGLPGRLRGRGIDEMEGGVGQREAGSMMMGEYEHRGVEGRVVSPPSLPVEVLPRTPLGSELVAAHDLGTDVPAEVANEVVVQPSGSAGLAAVRPAGGGERPGAQVDREADDAATSVLGLSEGRLEALTLAGTEPVRRQEEVLHS